MEAHFVQRENALKHLQTMISLAKAAVELSERVAPHSVDAGRRQLDEARKFHQDLSRELILEREATDKTVARKEAPSRSRDVIDFGDDWPFGKRNSPFDQPPFTNGATARPKSAEAASPKPAEATELFASAASLLGAAKPLLEVLAEIAGKKR